MATLLTEVSDFLASGPMKLFIGGQWVDAVRKGRFETRDPGTGKVLAEVAAAEQEDVNRAVEAAQQAFKKSGWPALPANDRAVILHRLADLIDKHQDILAQIESLDVGKPIAQAASLRRTLRGADAAILCRPFGPYPAARAHRGFRTRGLHAARALWGMRGHCALELSFPTAELGNLTSASGGKRRGGETCRRHAAFSNLFLPFGATSRRARWGDQRYTGLRRTRRRSAGCSSGHSALVVYGFT